MFDRVPGVRTYKARHSGHPVRVIGPTGPAAQKKVPGTPTVAFGYLRVVPARHPPTICPQAADLGR
jgi:hypothetical protein